MSEMKYHQGGELEHMDKKVYRVDWKKKQSSMLCTKYWKGAFAKIPIDKNTYKKSGKGGIKTKTMLLKREGIKL